VKGILASPWTKAVGSLVCLMPLAFLGLRAVQRDPGANPVEFITHANGDWALRLLFITLAVTPLRRILGTLPLRAASAGSSGGPRSKIQRQNLPGQPRSVRV
jgi:DMSO/TMAO reductase YedYZ heme-binding membrane subunit